MKYLLITLITPLFFNSFISQKTQIDNTTIWYNGVFYPENISGVNSMNDGEHFTSLDTIKKQKLLKSINILTLIMKRWKQYYHLQTLSRMEKKRYHLMTTNSAQMKQNSY